MLYSLTLSFWFSQVAPLSEPKVAPLVMVGHSHIITWLRLPPKYDAAKSGFEMCFAIGSQHLWCRGPNQNTSRIPAPLVPGPQPKHASDPESTIKEV